MEDGIFLSLKKASEDFTIAVGRMSLSWADLEHQLYRVLVHYAGVSDPVARALFSGTRAKAMSDNIVAILQNTKASEPRKSHFQTLAAQIGTINTMRDMVTHSAGLNWGGVSTDGKIPKRQISDISRIKRIENAKFLEIDDTTLGDMCKDMTTIRQNLQHHLRKDEFQDALTGKIAWQYKSPQPMQFRKLTPQSDPKRQSQQKSSRGKRQ